MKSDEKENQDSESLRTILSEAVKRVSHIETLLFSASGLMLAAVYFSIKGETELSISSRYAVCGVLVSLVFVFIHLLSLLMAYSDAVVSIEDDLKVYGLWRRAITTFKWPFYITYTVIVVSPVLMAGGTIGYLLRAQSWVAIVAPVSLIAASFTLIAATTYSHLKVFHSTDTTENPQNEEET